VLVCYGKMLLVIVSSSNSQSVSGRGGWPITAVSIVIRSWLKTQPGGQAATKDDAMMEPATETRSVILFGPFSLDASRRIELGARTLRVLIELVSPPNEVEEIAAAARFSHVTFLARLIGMFGRERGRRL
jgi:hypothetical protein